MNMFKRVAGHAFNRHEQHDIIMVVNVVTIDDELSVRHRHVVLTKNGRLETDVYLALENRELWKELP